MNAINRTAKDSIQAKLSALEAGYCPFEGADKYSSLLRQVGTAFGVVHKRQTPLVNAGYAIRTAIILDQIHTFLNYHSESPVYIILFGAGLDVTGLWALASMDHPHLHVIEVDMKDIVVAKKEFLINSTIFINVEEKEGIFTGVKSQSATKVYSLFEADLRDCKTLEAKLNTLMDVGQNPTLVISELVLAYLSTDHCDDLLRFSANSICQFEGSAISLYEPFGPSRSDVSSVLNCYKQAYQQKFSARLEKGESERGDMHSVFTPFADSRCTAVERMRRCGFAEAKSAVAQDVMSALEFVYGEASFRVREQFDEHAALALHLQSYGLTVGLPTGSIARLGQCLCPWQTGIRPVRFESEDHCHFWLSGIEEHDVSVRELFTAIYEPYFHQYPAVKKMHKHALKNGFLASSCSEGKSDIGQKFRSEGGCFIVATSTSSEEVVGGVGIRRCSNEETGIRKNAYEIHHLFVRPDFRGKGIARALSRMVLQVVNNKCRVVAATISILEEANSFYRSEGFDFVEESVIGDLTMHSYAKYVSR